MMIIPSNRNKQEKRLYCHVEATTGCPYGIYFYLSKSKRFVNN